MQKQALIVALVLAAAAPFAHATRAAGLSAVFKTKRAQDLARSGEPDPTCATGVLSLDRKTCCAGFCGECSDYPTCEKVRGQSSKSQCCKSAVAKLRCGAGASADVCRKTCSKGVPPCSMDMEVVIPKVDRHAKTDCNEAVKDWRKKAATATTPKAGGYGTVDQVVDKVVDKAVDKAVEQAVKEAGPAVAASVAVAAKEAAEVVAEDKGDAWEDEADDEGGPNTVKAEVKVAVAKAVKDAMVCGNGPGRVDQETAKSSRAWTKKDNHYCKGNWNKDWAARTVAPKAACQAKCAADDKCVGVTVGDYDGVKNNCALCTSTITAGGIPWTTTYIKGEASSGFSKVKCGRSPGGGVIKKYDGTVDSLKKCMQKCKANNKCKAIIYRLGNKSCHTLSRTYNKEFTTKGSGDAVVSNRQ